LREDRWIRGKLIKTEIIVSTKPNSVQLSYFNIQVAYSKMGFNVPMGLLSQISFNIDAKVMFGIYIVSQSLSQPHFGLSVRMKLTLKSGDLESSVTPKNLELDCRGKNTSHWGVLYINGKVLKFRCPKWPHMSHLDICSPSYGQKKGWESN